MSKKRKRVAVVGGLLVLLLVAGGIVAALAPTPKKGEYPEADQKSFLAGCEEGKTPDPVLCHCVLAKTEANYSFAAYKALAEELKRGAPDPPRYKKLAVECSSPKGNWDAEAQNRFVSNCSGGKQDLGSSCRCLARKAEMAYSGVELEVVEASHDARYAALNNKWIGECESPKGKWNRPDQKALLAGCEPGRSDAASFCHCMLAKSEAAYSFADIHDVETGHDARLQARFRATLRRFASECARRSSPTTSH